MTLIYSFLFCGLICLIGQIILDNSNLTPGHITSLFVVIGSILGFFGIYDKIISFVGVGANLPIMCFGNAITNSVYDGFLSSGFLGLFSDLFKASSLSLSATIIFSFILTLFFNPKD